MTKSEKYYLDNVDNTIIRYKKGDKVIVRSDISDAAHYGIASSMKVLKGKEVTIQSSFANNNITDTVEYKIVEEDGDCIWSNSDFLPVFSENVEKLIDNLKL